jgi:hypothetical protein
VPKKKSEPCPSAQQLAQWLEEAPTSVYGIMQYMAEQGALWGYQYRIMEEEYERRNIVLE